MKKLLLLALSIFAFLSIKAQDLVVLKNADEIQVKVLKISPESVQYKQWSNLDGPIYEINKSDIFYIKYQNGEKEIINDIITQEKSAKSKTGNKPFVKFRGYTYGGVVFDSSSAGPTFDITLGINIDNYMYIGIETGVYSNFENYTTIDGFNKMFFGVYIPLGGNIKVYCIKDKPIIPFINCSLSGFWGIAGAFKNSRISGFCSQVGLGIDTKDCSFTIGYSPLVATSILGIPLNITAHCGYAKIGVRF